MFTGIVAAVGTVASCEKRGGDLRVVVQVGDLDLSDVEKGDSIAVNGACLTVVRFDDKTFTADVSMETVSLTAEKQWKPGVPVNLEKALTPTTRLGGHMMTGHVDGVGRVVRREPVGQSILFVIEAPSGLARYLAKKGSVSLDGISLTVNNVEGRQIYLNIVPHTADVTNVAAWTVGTDVNLEVDIIARYLERLLLGDQAAEPGSDASRPAPTGEGITARFLAEHGFFKQ